MAETCPMCGSDDPKLRRVAPDDADSGGCTVPRMVLNDDHPHRSVAPCPDPFHDEPAPDSETPEGREAAPKGTVRRYRQELSAVLGRLTELRDPITEGIRTPQVMVADGLTRLIDLCDEIDREWAKVDPRPIGGEIAARRRA